MLYINDWSIKMLKKRFSNYAITANCPSGSWQTSRYIQIFIDGYDKDLHYEYRIDRNWNGRVELHFEGDWESKYGVLIDCLINKTQNSDELIWSEWGSGYRCQHANKIDTIEDLYHTLLYMMDIFNKNIGSLTSELPAFEKRTIPCNESLPVQLDSVDIFERKYKDLVHIPLCIPNYQRIYCWEEENVKCLLDDVFEHVSSNNNVPYRLGTIILHSHDGKYDIIDGQQRLITLALLLSELGVETSLLNEQFSSNESIEYVAYNKHLINEYVNRHLNVRDYVVKLLDLLEFSVLVLQNTSIDLAYTFFSNQNSRGVDLTDYDLLKAHHLRYIPLAFELQSQHAAEVWNKMIEDGRAEEDQTSVPDYVRTLDTYIYRLRKWIRKKECDDSTHNYRIKKEFEAAPIIDEIPPFGERFYYNEPIQGGTHFFSYVEQHVAKYRLFSNTEEFKILHFSLQGNSNQWYRDAIESILFCYYLKFGTYYLSDALMVIMRIILQHRYVSPRAIKSSIVKYAGDSELVSIIDQATSPTFFLAEARNIAKEMSYPTRQSMSPIMRSMRMKASNISKRLEQSIVVESFKYLNR
ncbi:MAG: DUF262 domain-containing protein [Paludibacteraceae bacterium]|nr:DUF262 domain-containing protein [Bacteroidales bacterium]MDY4513007.1 DUF262 domain-containing protein [Paludibacteraceae bacterium]